MEMKHKKRPENLGLILTALAVLTFSFTIMPAALAIAPSKSPMQTVSGNASPYRRENDAETQGSRAQTPDSHSQTQDSYGETPDSNTTPDSHSQTQDSCATPDINAISRQQAIAFARQALAESGFDLEDFKQQPVETLYLSEIAPVGAPVWAVIFRDDQSGYAYLFGDEMTDEAKEKLAAVGDLEECMDENNTPGLRAYYSYVRYTLVEINAHTGAYIQHGTAIVEPGRPLVLDQLEWMPDSWVQGLQQNEPTQTPEKGSYE